MAKELRLDWSTVNALEMQYMRAQLRRHPPPKPAIIGIDEVSLRKGHVYRIVVSDLVRHRPLWFGGKDRSEDSMDAFYKELGSQASGKPSTWSVGANTPDCRERIGGSSKGKNTRCCLAGRTSRVPAGPISEGY